MTTDQVLQATHRTTDETVEALFNAVKPFTVDAPPVDQLTGIVVVLEYGQNRVKLVSGHHKLEAAGILAHALDFLSDTLTTEDMSDFVRDVFADIMSGSPVGL